MIDLEYHPAAGEFPLLDDGRMRDLAEDIKVHGQREPLRTCGGMILDGRNRYLACRAAGIEPRIEQLPDHVNPFAYVWSLNGQRRDLTQDQRYLIWKSCARQSGAWQAKRQRLQDRANHGPVHGRTQGGQTRGWTAKTARGRPRRLPGAVRLRPRRQGRRLASRRSPGAPGHGRAR